MRKSRYLIIAFGIFLSTVSIAQDNGLSFDGIDDYVEFNSNPVFSSVRTFEAWIYPTSTTGFKTISEWSDGVDNDLRFYMNNNRLELSEFDGIQFGSVTGTGTITANQWNHIAFVETVSGYIFYIDGVADPVGFSAATAGLTPIFNLGSIRSGFNYFEGIIDEVRVWNVELNQATIESQRFSELTGAEPNLIAYYQFNESSGTVLPDLTSNALDGTLLNGLANTPPADGITNGPLWVASSALPDPFIVTNTNNTGVGSLRWCIGNANATAGPNEITFDATLTGLTISLASSLTITSGNGDGTTIDGDIDGNGTPDITIVPGGTNFDGIIITASNCTLKSLHMKDFTSGIYSAIHVRNSTATNNKIIGCRLGVSADGTTTDGATIGQAIQIRDGADGTLIGDGTEAGANVIGNSATGIIMWFSAVNTVVSGNYIGISLNGSDVGNDYGIRLFNNTVANTKIGVAGAMPNIISYNNRPIRSEGISTTIVNNYIGTDRTGLLARGNTGTIVIHLNNSKDTNVGDGTIAGRNIIAGNANATAIHLQNATDNTRIYGNYIGIGADGSTTLANGSGIKIDVTPTNTFIGNGTVEGRNIISSSTGFSLNGQGIYAAGPSTTIQGNYIGTDATGTLNRGNNQSGILLAGSFTGTVGGTVAGQGNLISGNSDGIKIQVSGANILGNYIGTDVTGTLAIPNTNEGIWLDTNGANTIIGDGTAAGANIIAFNPTGILASGATVQNNIWTQNSIYSNGTGISIASGAQGGVIPPVITNIAPDGTISGTSGLFADIEVYFDSVDQGEYFYGTTSADAAGIWSVSGSLASIPPGLTFATAIQLDLGNSSAFSPPYLDPFTVVNTNDSGIGSLRAAITNANGSSGETISFNIPNTDPNYALDGGTGNETWTIYPITDLPAITQGVVLDATTQPGTGNYKIKIDGQGTRDRGFNVTGGYVEVYGFYLTGFDVFSQSAAILISHLDVMPSTIGAVNKGNVINSSRNGIRIQFVDDCIIKGNLIGTDETGQLAMGNTQYGINIAFADRQIIGGLLPGEKNLISGNSFGGIVTTTSSSNIIQGNYIGTNMDGTIAIPNATGIQLGSNGQNQVLDNLISGNSGSAIQLANSDENTIRGNIIGEATNGSALGNNRGIRSSGTLSTSNNIIGGLGVGERNIIANNTNQAIFFHFATVINNTVIGNTIYCNGSGIDLNGVANNNIQPPTITSISATSVSGTGTPGDEVHLYKDNSGCTPLQGAEFLNSAIVDGAGDWVISGLTIDTNNDEITATATNGTDGTSEFTSFIPAPFITTWQTDILGTTANNQVYITTSGTGYNYDIYWEEVGNEATNNGTEPAGQTGAYTITFPSPGTYRVHISGSFPRIRFGVFDKNKLLTVEQWGNQIWASMRQAFDGCTNLNITATDAPNLSVVTDMSRMFMFCANLNADLNNWDVSNVNDMSDLFNQATTFNGDISSWDVSNVTTMEQMFWNAPAFNQNISAWNVSSVTSMRNMFISATSFNQNIGSWNVNNVTDMYGMFGAASAFDQDISSWNVTGVTAMASMFSGAASFNQPIGGWDVSAITDMSAMFANASVFNQDLSAWDVSNVTNMISMFYNASAFNGNISTWDVSSVANMSGMFFGSTSFDQPLNLWNVGSVTTMAQMFEGATSFNQSLTNWDVSAAGNLQMMFKNAPAFNQDISGWNVSNIISTREMFLNATSFDQNLGGWDIQLVSFMSNMFDNSGLSVTNYDATLIGWDALPTLQSGITLGAAGLNYCAAETARNNIISTYGWTITGDILNCAPANPFITTWQTNNPGTSNADQITIPTNGAGYSYDIYWEEIGNPGNNGTEPSGQTGDYTITFPSSGQYRVDISGSFPSFYFFSGGDKQKLLSVEQWGSNPWTSLAYAFYNCPNLRINALDSPDLSSVTSLEHMFRGATSFNDDISSWDVGNVTNLWLMFSDATSFNQDLSTWDVSNVTTMRSMFEGATAFNQNIGGWDVSNVTTMEGMFRDATAFNQPIGTWNVSSVANMRLMFSGATSFNQDLSTWNTASLTNTSDMFLLATSFNQEIGTWNMSGVTQLQQMFRGAAAFNGDIDSWDVSSATDFTHMFSQTSAFNQSLASWDVSGATNMLAMFLSATAFDQSLASWDVSNVTNMNIMLEFSGLSIANYDATLIGWNSLTILEPNVTLGATGLEYCAAISARDNLINTHGWIITGDTENCGACASPPTANAGTDLTIDEGNTAPLAGTIGGSATTLTWTTSGDGSFNDNTSASAVYTPGSADIANGSVNLTLTTDDPDGAGPCVTASDDLVLTIIPASTNTFNIFEGAEINGNPISVGQTNIDVGSTLVGLDLDSDFTIENNQLTTLNISAITSTDPAFEVLNVPANVLPGNTEVFTIRLVATEVGVFNTNIVITSDFAPFNFSMVGEVTATEPGTITVYNAVSPNGDGMHDYLEIAGIELFSLNRVAVMNRWGDIVYEASGYDNNNIRFEGISNNGSELPTGTYFYQIDLGDGSDMISGFISLRK